MSLAVRVKPWLSVAFFALGFLVMILVYCMMGYVTFSSQPVPSPNTYIINLTSCQPQNYILFIKVHKTGSTSIMNILQRYGLARNLTFILPLVNNYLGKHTTLRLSRKILVPPDNQAINILCNHVVYNRSAFRAVLAGRRVVDGRNQDETGGSCSRNHLITPGEKGTHCGSRIDANRSTINMRDYTLFTMIRRPLSQVLSAVYYYKLFPEVAPNDLMDAILRTPTLFTNNRMSFDLGLPPPHFHNPTKVQEFIAGLSADFQFVLLLEYFDESMVLLRRRLCWQTPDILYIKRNAGENRPRIRVTSEQRELFRRERAPADSALYDYFRPRFWRMVHDEGSDFFEEVHHYRSLLSLVRDYCSYVEYQQFNPDPLRGDEFDENGPNHTGGFGDNDNPLTIAASQWHSEFTIGTEDCNIMSMEELPLVDLIRQLEYRNQIQ